MLELRLDLVDDRRVQQLAKLDVAEQVAQLRLVHEQGLRAAFGQRGIPVVDEVADVAEEKRRRER